MPGILANTYMQFDLSPVLRFSINKITLHENRTYLGDDYSFNPGRGVYASIRGFKSKSGNDPPNISQITPNTVNSLISTLSGVVNVSAETNTGSITRDVTSLLPIEETQNGILGICYLGNLTNTVYSNSNNFYLVVDYTAIPNPAPTIITPSQSPVATYNPKGPIAFEWWHNENTSSLLADPVTGTLLTYWQNTNNKKTVTVSGAGTSYTLPANTFADYTNVTFTLQTITQYNGTGTAVQGVFYLGSTPPLAPVLVYPVDVDITAASGALLIWEYNSQYENNASGYDVRYRINSGSWKQYSISGDVRSYTTESISYQATVEWQVRAYGTLGDVGPWSVIGEFLTIGVPDPPIIKSVSNSNKPRVNFSAANIAAYTIQIVDENRNPIYDSGYVNFEQSFYYDLQQFLPNGKYYVLMKITNQYSIESDWAESPFQINTVFNYDVNFRIFAGGKNDCVSLGFKNDYTAHIYRSPVGKNQFIKVGSTKDEFYKDYAACPGKNYKYFVRIENSAGNISDSTIKRGSFKSLYTMLSKVTEPESYAKLIYNLDSKPTKSLSFSRKENTMQVFGSEYPISLPSNSKSKSVSYSFYVLPDEYDKVLDMVDSSDYLILRDHRHGTIFGKIPGGIKSNPQLDGYMISFIFEARSYSEELSLDG